MISSNAKRYCRDDISLIKNYDKALADETEVWFVHHRNGEPFTGFKRADLIKMNMYYKRPASELMFVNNDMHDEIHGNSKNWGTANKGKKASAETKKKMSDARKGKELSAETKSKMSAARLGKALSSDHKTAISMGLKGHKISAETRAKISAAMKAKYK